MSNNFPIKLFFVLLIMPFWSKAQVGIHTGVATNGATSSYGIPLSLSYDYEFSKKFSLNAQINAQYTWDSLEIFNVDLNSFAIGPHILGSYTLLNKNKWKLKFRGGLNYRFQDHNAKMSPTSGSAFPKFLYYELRKEVLYVNSVNILEDNVKDNNLGFTIQIPNELIIDKSTIVLTPFWEDDNGHQTVGGLYIGYKFKSPKD